MRDMHDISCAVWAWVGVLSWLSAVTCVHKLLPAKLKRLLKNVNSIFIGFKLARSEIVGVSPRSLYLRVLLVIV